MGETGTAVLRLSEVISRGVWAADGKRVGKLRDLTIR
jgi:hypothetical protein